MQVELREDNLRLVAHMRDAHASCDEREDVATASLLRGLDRRRGEARMVSS
jgi:starvation-inducible DNA-binding protein